MTILTSLLGLFSNDLYIQVWENRIKASSIQTQTVFDQMPLVAIETNKAGQKVVREVGNACKSVDPNQYQIINPFSHPRMLLGDFLVAEKLLQFIVKELHKGKFFTPAPRIIFHPMEKVEGGLNLVEDKAFRELCLGAGARAVAIHLGDELSQHDLSTKDKLNDFFGS
jgi:rod shape-determining protein MreB